MSQVPRCVRHAVLVALCVVLFAPVASAAPLPPEPRSETTASRAVHFARFRDVLAFLWSKYGPMVDPDGAPASGTTTQSAGPCQGEYGPMVDPSGQCSDGR